MTFSERVGLAPDRTIAQIDEISPALRTDLWNTVYRAVYSFRNPGAMHLRDIIWTDALHLPLHSIDKYATADERHAVEVEQVAVAFLNGPWNVVYDIVEMIVDHPHLESFDDIGGGEWDAYESYPVIFVGRINALLGQHSAAYRLIAGHVMPLTNDLEIAEVEAAVTTPGLNAGAAHALDTAIALFADRQGEHHTAVVASTINAVESVAREVAIAFGAKSPDTLGKSLIALRKHLPTSRRILLDGWGQVFGFTSQTVRHGGPEDPEITAAEAQFFLVSASAFINLLLDYSAAPTPIGAVA